MNTQHIATEASKRKRRSKEVTRAEKAMKLIKTDAPHSARPLTLSGRCILGHTQTLTEAQIAEARSFGCAMCSTCGNAVIVASATNAMRIKMRGVNKRRRHLD